MKNEEMSVQVRIHVSQFACFGQESDLGGCLKLMGHEHVSGHSCCRIEGLVRESSGNMPYYYLGCLVRPQLPSKSQERA